MEGVVYNVSIDTDTLEWGTTRSVPLTWGLDSGLDQQYPVDCGRKRGHRACLK